MEFQEEAVSCEVVDVKIIQYEEVDASHENEEMELEIPLLSPPPGIPPKNPKLKSESTKRVGRRPQDVWNEFKVTVLSPTKKMTVCRHCSKKTSVGARAYRLREHLMKCDQYLKTFENSSSSSMSPAKANRKSIKTEQDRLEKVRSAFTKPRKGDIKGQNGRRGFSQLEGTSETKTDSNSPQNVSKEDNDVVEMEKEKLSRLLVRFLISSKIPFTIVKNEELRAFIKMLRPGYTLPTTASLNGALLKDVYNEFRAECNAAIRGEKVVLIQSGWTNSSTSSKRLITHALQHRTKIYLFNTIEVPCVNVSAHLCQELIRDTISMVENDFECKVIGAVTDNITHFLEVKTMLETFDPSLLVQASLFHLLLYIGHCFIDDDVLDRVIKVWKYFRSYDYQCDQMMEEINPSPDIRWYNYKNAVMAYNRDRERYLEILADPTYRNSNGRIQVTGPNVQIQRKATAVEESEFFEILNDSAVIHKATEMTEVLKPLQISIEFLEKDRRSLADGVSCWLSWMNNTNISTNGQILKMIDMNQYKKIAITPPGLTAYMLSPKYKGVLLTEEEVEIGREYILSVNIEYLDPIVAFMQSDDSMYSKSLIKDAVCKTMDPIRWWKEQTRNAKLPTGFVSFVLSLMSLPASINSLERCFSA